MEKLAAHLSAWIADTVTSSGGKGAVFGLSGGLDSAVVAALCKRAFPNHALGLLMPCHSEPVDAEDARLVAHHFGVASASVDLTETFDALFARLSETLTDLGEDALAQANIKPRLRMTTLYAFASHLDYRVVGCGNRSELAVGYFTKYGDGGSDLLPLGNLTKTRVRELAQHLDVPRRIIDRPPSAGLWPGQTDERDMGLTYAALDAYLSGASDAGRERIEALATA
ncbi:MAG TPA: NAD(+) synthase, partial [Thermoleophilia bacterium]|nr:NAD(+) synthase [Thermoleophilia bacterium]